MKLHQRFIIYGRPVSQKNSKQIARSKGGRACPACGQSGGRTFIVSNPKVKGWHKDAAKQLAFLKTASHPLTCTLVGTIYIYQGRGQCIDCDNLPAAPLDALKNAGIVKNDYQFDELHIYRRRDPKDPRVEIVIESK